MSTKCQKIVQVPLNSKSFLASSAHHAYTLEDHRMDRVVRDYSGPSGPTSLLKQGHPVAHGNGKNNVPQITRLGAGKLTERAAGTHLDSWEEASSSSLSVPITDLVVHYSGRFPKENLGSSDRVENDNLHGLQQLPKAPWSFFFLTPSPIICTVVRISTSLSFPKYL